MGIDLAVEDEADLFPGFGKGGDPVSDVCVGVSGYTDPGLLNDCGEDVIDDMDLLGDGTDVDPGLEAPVGGVSLSNGSGGGGGRDSVGLSGSNLHDPKQLLKFSVAFLMIMRRASLIAKPHSVCDISI